MVKETNLLLIDTLTPQQIAVICDHTFLNRSEAYRQAAGKGDSPVQLRAKAFLSFIESTVANPERLPYAVCVRPENVTPAINYLAEKGHSEVKVASVVGFPDGSLYDTGFKAAETQLALARGAEEIDMVLNYARFKAGDLTYVRTDIQSVVDAAHRDRALVKLILETSELDGDQIKRACELASCIGVDFVKTSTGFAAGGAKAEDVAVMRANFEGGVKISGGIVPENVKELLYAASGRRDGYIEMNPLRVRIGESSLLAKL